MGSPYAPGVTRTRPSRIFHLVAAADWERERSADSQSVAREHFERNGFVHCCTREQIDEIARWWLADEAPLIALEIDAGLAGDVRWERADLGRVYPHVYNPLPRAALVAERALQDTATPPPSFLVEGRFAGRDVTVRWCDGALVDGDLDVIDAANALVASSTPIRQFPDVTAPASTASAYEAFCLIAAVLDDVVDYFGDGASG